jgi:hypothetical protein
MIEIILFFLFVSIIFGFIDAQYKIQDRSSCSRLYSSKNLFTFLFTDRY